MRTQIKRYCLFMALLFMLHAAGYGADCGFVPVDPWPTDDLGEVADTIVALCLWTVPDTANCRSTFPDDPCYCATSYEYPEWAFALWDETRELSVPSFMYENSNGLHVVTADTRVRPDSLMWVVPTQYGGDHWNSDYVYQAILAADGVVNFSDYDQNSDCVVDRLIIYECSIDGRGTFITQVPNFSTFDTCFVNGLPAPMQIHDVVVVRCNREDFLLAFGLSTHEYGHTISSDGEIIQDLYGYTNSTGLGGFCCQASNGFSNESYTDARPALHNPIVRTGDYWLEPPPEPWVDPIRIVSTQLDYRLFDYELDQSIYLVQPQPEDSGQYFLLTHHSKRGNWDRYYPEQGLLIWHADTIGRPDGLTINNEGGPKRLDIEHGGGMWNWTSMQLNDTFPALDNCEEAFEIRQVTARRSLGVPNTESGLDSFDVRFVSPFGNVSQPVYSGNTGSAATMYTAGEYFSPYTNPNSDLWQRRSGSPPIQNVYSGVEILVVHSDSTSLAHIIVDGWYGTLQTTATWRDTVVVTQTFAVAAWADMTIEPGTVVLVENGVSIIIFGELTALGTSGSPIVFKAKDTGERWNGLTINGGSIEMDYVNLQDFKDHGVYVESPDSIANVVRMEHVDLNCAKLKKGGIGLRLWNSPSVTQTVDSMRIYNLPADSSAVGMYLYNCKVNFDQVTIEDCDHINSYIKKVTGDFHRCNFRDRTEYYAVLFNSTPNTPNFRCCNFIDVAPLSGSWQASVFCATGTSPSFGGEGDTGGDGVSNTFTDSCAHLMTMQGSLALPVVDSDPPVPPQYGSSDGGKNDWKNRKTEGKYIQWASPGVTTYPCTGQYWANGIDTNRFTPNVAARWDFDPYETSEWSTCGGGEGGGGSSIDDGPLARGDEGTLDDGEMDAVLSDALAFESEEDYGAAQELYRYVAEHTSGTSQRWFALTHVVVCESFTQSGASWFGGLLDDMIALEDSYESRVLGERLRTSYHQNRNEYENAIVTCTALLSSGLTYEDSIYVAIDLVGLQLGAGDGGSLDGASATHLIPATLRARDDSEALQIERELFAQLNLSLHDQRDGATVPSEFRLYQNYPNPFNPTTQIEFDLPEAVRVSLRVFNTLGQEVATVSDGKFNAGHYVMTWNGKSSTGADVATGLYVYQIQAGSFADTKKMILMR